MVTAGWRGRRAPGCTLPGPVPSQGLSWVIIWSNRSLWRPAPGVGSPDSFLHPLASTWGFQPRGRRTVGGSALARGGEEPARGQRSGPLLSQPLTFPTTRAPWLPRDCLGTSPQLREPRTSSLGCPWAPGLPSAHLPPPASAPK